MSYLVGAEEWQRALPPAVIALVNTSVPADKRMPVAKGLAPLPPRELVYALSYLCADAAAEVAQTARTTLSKMPDGLVMPIAKGDTPPPVLAMLLQAVAVRPTLIEAVVANRNTPDLALCDWAPTAPATIAEMLAQDQQRCLRCEALVVGLSHNSQLLKSSLDKLVDFLVRSGVMVDVPAVGEAVSRLTPAEMQVAAAQIALPEAAAPLLVEAAVDPAAPEPTPDVVTPAPEAPDAAHEPAVEARVPMMKLVNTLNMAQKIALATKGNKEARSILLRDANRIVAVAAIRNPRITDQEVQAAAKSRSINDEVIRIIANSKDMTRSYGTKLALVNNPKTPLPVALRFLTTLRATDLKAVAKSKGLPQTLVTQAKKLVASKDSGG